MIPPHATRIVTTMTNQKAARNRLAANYLPHITMRADVLRARPKTSVAVMGYAATPQPTFVTASDGNEREEPNDFSLLVIHLPLLTRLACRPRHRLLDVVRERGKDAGGLAHQNFPFSAMAAFAVMTHSRSFRSATD